MTQPNGWLKVYRSMLDWDLYSELNTFRLFFHCLLMANFTDANSEGKEVKRGNFITSLSKLSEETGLTIKAVRVALGKLESTNNLENIELTNSRMIRVCNYEFYQDLDESKGYHEGWIKIYRSIINWEWYCDINTFRLFIHCLLKANFKDIKWCGQVVKKGQFITSLPKLSEKTGLTNKAVRIALSKLVKTKSLVSLGASRYRTLTVCNYKTYQKFDDGEGSLGAGKGQAEGKQRADEGQARGRRGATSKEFKNLKNLRKERDARVRASFAPPSLLEVRDYFFEKNFKSDPDFFFDHFENNGWKVSGKTPMKKWQLAANNWERREKAGVFNGGGRYRENSRKQKIKDLFEEIDSVNLD